MIALMIAGCVVHLAAIEYISGKKSKGEILLFRRGRVPYIPSNTDEEANMEDRITSDIFRPEGPVFQSPKRLQEQTAVFQWSDVTYDIGVRKNTRRLLHQIDGWVKPGRLTALMVSSSLFASRCGTSLDKNTANTLSRVSLEPARPLYSTY